MPAYPGSGPMNPNGQFGPQGQQGRRQRNQRNQQGPGGRGQNMRQAGPGQQQVRLSSNSRSLSLSLCVCLFAHPTIHPTHPPSPERENAWRNNGGRSAMIDSLIPSTQ